MIKRVTLKKQAYDYLLNAIVEEKIKPLEVYSEQYFADFLEISRTPIREAVLQLLQEGFLQIHPNKGFSVRPISNKELTDLFDLRCAVEGYCAMFVAEKYKTIEGEQLIKRLKHLAEAEQKSCENDEDALTLMEKDTQFHGAIIDFADNVQFKTIMKNLRAKIRMIGLRSLYREGRKSDTITEHKEILKAISSGDKMGAYYAVKKHFDECQSIIMGNRK